MEEEKFKSLFDKFADGKVSKTETSEFSDALNDGVDSSFETLSRKMWDAASADMNEADEARMRSELLGRISSDERNKVSRTRRVVLSVTRYAVAAAVMIAVAFGGYEYALNHISPKTFDVMADRGQKSEITLPDGSHVWLNSASKITYTSEYNDKQRLILLDGEAYFEVAHNKDVPFIVKSGDFEVLALGTKFNVKAYADEDDIVATLIEGKVRTSAGEHSAILHPNEETLYFKTTGAMASRPVSYTDHAVPWRNNELVFDGENLREIAALLQRMYNVEIIFSDSSVANYSFTGVVRNNSLTNVLDLITSTAPVQYRTYGNTIKFSAR